MLVIGVSRRQNKETIVPAKKSRGTKVQGTGYMDLLTE